MPFDFYLILVYLSWCESCEDMVEVVPSQWIVIGLAIVLDLPIKLSRPAKYHMADVQR